MAPGGSLPAGASAIKASRHVSARCSICALVIGSRDPKANRVLADGAKIAGSDSRCCQRTGKGAAKPARTDGDSRGPIGATDQIVQFVIAGRVANVYRKGTGREISVELVTVFPRRGP